MAIVRTSEEMISIFERKRWISCGSMLRNDINDLAAFARSYGDMLRKVIRVRVPEDATKLLVFYKDPA